METDVQPNLEAFSDLDWGPLLELAFREDRVGGDVTTLLCESFLKNRLGADHQVEFALVSREVGVFCGERLLEHLSSTHGWSFESKLADGDEIRVGTYLAQGRAPWARLLSQERSVLNLLQLLSGIATETRVYKKLIDDAFGAWSDEDQMRHKKPSLYHTRKTMPGLRAYQVYAACVGGAMIHRLHLADRVMLKDNHKLILESQGEGFVDLIGWARGRPGLNSDLWLIEADSPDEALRLNAVGAKHLLLDNFSATLVSEILPALRNVESIEVSGGLRLENLAEYVLPGVHRLSIGALTHSVRSLDISMEFS